MKRKVIQIKHLAVIIVSAYEPPLPPKFIDRYLILLKSNNIPLLLVMNKRDLKTTEDDAILSIYKEIGIKVIETSIVNNEGVDELKKLLNGKQSIFVGHSGVGKSSLINAIMQVNEIQNYFPEFIKFKNKCKYKDCLHYEESIEVCSIKRGVKKKLIHKERYESYAKIISEILKKKEKEDLNNLFLLKSTKCINTCNNLMHFIILSIYLNFI